MKLVNKAFAGQNLSMGHGLVAVDKDGCVEIEDKAVAATLQEHAGFKPVFARKDDSATQKVEAPKVEDQKTEEFEELATRMIVSSTKVTHKKR